MHTLTLDSEHKNTNEQESGKEHQIAENTATCFPCPVCDLVFSDENSLKGHTQGGHNNKQSRSLTTSGKTLELTPHFGKTHSKFMLKAREANINGDHHDVNSESSESDEEEVTEEEQTFDCDKCNYKGIREANLERHKNEVHPKSFGCSKCHYKTVRQDELKHHMKEHQEHTTCTVCGESFDNVTILQVHILTKHCTQSDIILELLRKQELVISSMEKQIKLIAKKVNLGSPLSPAPQVETPQVEPPTSYSTMVRAPAPQQVRTEAVLVPVKKISYITDSIGSNVMFDELEKITKAKIKRRKAYGSVKATGQFKPEANFTDVVPKEMKENKPEVLVLQRDSVTLTNLSPDTPTEYSKQQVLLASYNMFTAATNALASNPQCQQVILMEAAPRYDDKEELNRFGNAMLHQAKAESTNKDKDKVRIGIHNLECEGGLRASRYGDGRNGEIDMVHMRGTSGKVAFTRSVASILASAGLTTPQEAAMVARNQEVRIKRSGGHSFQAQTRKGWVRPRQQHQQLSTFQLATQNRFSGYQENY